MLETTTCLMLYSHARPPNLCPICVERQYHHRVLSMHHFRMTSADIPSTVVRWYELNESSTTFNPFFDARCQLRRFLPPPSQTSRTKYPVDHCPTAPPEALVLVLPRHHARDNPPPIWSRQVSRRPWKKRENKCA